MKQTIASFRYAKALFLLQKKEKQLEQTEKELHAVSQILAKHPEVSKLMLNSAISLAHKEVFLKNILAGKIAENLIYFLLILIKKKRFAEFPSIQEEFRRLYKKEKGIREITVITAQGLSSKNEEALRKLLEKKLRSEIRFIPKTNPHILGGLILQFEGNEINASYQSRLQELKQQLLS